LFGWGRDQETVQQYKLLVSELEAVLPVMPLQRWADSGGTEMGGAEADPLRVLPAALQNLHDYLIHVAARLERLHEAVDRAKGIVLAAMRKVDARSLATDAHAILCVDNTVKVTNTLCNNAACGIEITNR
jgi:hypothetical protein